MHGLFGSYGTTNKGYFKDLTNPTLITRRHEQGALQLTQITIPKFLNDKYFAEYDDCFIATEGVLLEADTAEEAIARYRRGETIFWNSWRGSFAGLLYDSRTDKLLLFNDHIGSKMIFYTIVDGRLVFASDLRLLANATHAQTLHEPFARKILDKGCTDDNSTFVHNIFRLMAGEYLCMQQDECRCCTYHRFDNTPYPYNEEEMIRKANSLLRQAVARVIRKNEKEGLEHFFPLSGGLDSRMCQLIAHEYATQPITNFTFSQTGHYDHLLPEQITRYLGNKWQFMPLDGGAYITDIDEVSEQSEWMVNYTIPLEIAYFARQQDWKRTGVVLTGINGENVFAAKTDNKHEMARIYRQGLNGYSLGSPLIMQYYTETYSPFCDVDVMNYMLHVPTEKRRNYYFYDRWVDSCYPQAKQWHHKYEQIGHRHRMVTIAGRNIRLRDVPRRIGMYMLTHLHIYDAYRVTKVESMNPYDTWAAENPAILEQLRQYHLTHKHLLAGLPWQKECEQKMRNGSIIEQGKVLTIESAIEHLNLSAGVK